MNDYSEYLEKAAIMAIDHDMTENEALAVLLYEEGLRGSDIAREMSKIQKKHVLPQSANSYKQRGLMKVSDPPEIVHDDDGNICRWGFVYDTNIFKGSDQFVTLCNDRDDAIGKARTKWYGHLTEEERRKGEITVGLMVLDEKRQFIGEIPEVADWKDLE